GDVGELVADVEWTLRTLSQRFAKVIWVPGNHELWTPRQDPVQLTGVRRYEYLVESCRRLGVVTPEDPYPIWDGDTEADSGGGGTGPVVVAPLFLLYDYTFRPAGANTKEEALAIAREAKIVCTDEYLLKPDPYPSIDAWSRARVKWTERRLLNCDPSLPTILVNHCPLVREPTRVLRYPEFAQWCGTETTADWHLRFRAAAVVYGHLHIPRTTFDDGVRFVEVSIGYPRERARWPQMPTTTRQILPAPPAASVAA
nr:metallophosphoesterase [Micromonospora sp. DSM 115978]